MSTSDQRPFKAKSKVLIVSALSANALLSGQKTGKGKVKVKATYASMHHVKHAMLACVALSIKRITIPLYTSFQTHPSTTLSKIPRINLSDLFNIHQPLPPPLRLRRLSRSLNQPLQITTHITHAPKRPFIPPN
jgi:hypothetical protein